MLKKALENLGYIAIMLSLGFAVYYYVLNPSSPLKNLNADYSALSTDAFFTSKLPNEKGINQALSQYKGKIVVLNFWATWCPPCREEMPELSELHTEYNDKNLVVIGVAVDELALVKEFAQDSPVSYPLLVAENAGMELSSNLGNHNGALPYTVIINANGKVVQTYLGRIDKSQISQAIRPLLVPK